MPVPETTDDCATERDQLLAEIERLRKTMLMIESWVRLAHSRDLSMQGALKAIADDLGIELKEGGRVRS